MDLGGDNKIQKKNWTPLREGSRRIDPLENWPPENWPLENCHLEDWSPEK